MLFVGSANAQNLILNPSFESGVASWTSPGWGADSVAHSGTGSAGTGCVGANCLNIVGSGSAPIYQDFTTTPGASYTVSFWYRTSGPTDYPIELQALFGSVSLTNGGAGTCTGNCIFGTTTATATYTQVTQTVTATAGTSRLMFLGRDDPSGIRIDDVSVVAASPLVVVPTLAEWAMISFALLIMGFGVYQQRRRYL